MKIQKEIINTELIEKYMVSNNLKPMMFCRKCQIPISTFRKIYLQDFNFDVKHLLRIAHTIGIHPKDMFKMIDVDI